jgi:hypothetical protein
VTGDADLLVHLLAASTQHVEAVLDRIRSAPTVVRVKSTLVLSRLFHRVAPPAPDTRA